MNRSIKTSCSVHVARMRKNGYAYGVVRGNPKAGFFFFVRYSCRRGDIFKLDDAKEIEWEDVDLMKWFKMAASRDHVN